MAKKRKADDLSTESPLTNRPRTRSLGLLNESLLHDTHPRKRPRRKGPPGIPASEFLGTADASGSPQQSGTAVDSANSDGSSCDKLNLVVSSSSKTKCQSHPPSDDELDLLGSSPFKANTERGTPGASTPRLPFSVKMTPRNRGQIMEVVITTPKAFPRTPQNATKFSPVSLSPSSRPRRGVKTEVSKATKPLSQNSPAPKTSSALSDLLSPHSPCTPPSKKAVASKPLPSFLPSRLQPYLTSQKSAILEALRHPPLLLDDDSAASSASNELTELLNGTIQRNEGNSCLVLGPRGSGKSRLVNHVLTSLPSTSTASPVVVRLSGHFQTNDRLAMREIARQIQQEVGPHFPLPELPGIEEEPEGSDDGEDSPTNTKLPPLSHLPTLISALPAMGRPIVVILDAFDGFAAHVRQALLYCLLDTVQSCRGGAPVVSATDEIADISSQTEGHPALSEDIQAGRQKPEVSREMVKGEHGLLVIGITSRVDCLTLLEKRVKSRFSHRVIRVRPFLRVEDFLRLVRATLHVTPKGVDGPSEEWKTLWEASVEKFLAHKEVYGAFREMFAFVRDLRVLCRLMVSPVLALTPSSPWLTASQLLSSVSIQRCRKRFPFLSALPYPQIALLIAATHALSSGQDTFNFEMLYDAFITRVRMSAAAPVQIAGSALGMMRVSRGVMIGAFEHLVTTCVFQPATAPASHITREFVKYRCVAERDEIKAAVEHLGQTNLKKWFHKAQ